MLSHARRLAALLAVAFLTACPAEMMGVELPRGGWETISQEDLQRDAWMLRRASPSQAGAVLVSRLGEMRVLPAFGRAWSRGSGPRFPTCGRKEGAGEDGWLLLARGEPSTAAGALAWAALISAAKGFDTRAAPAHTLLFCAVADAAGADALLAAPPLPVERLAGVVVFDGAVVAAPGAVDLATSRVSGPFHAAAAALRLPPRPDDRVDDLGAVDYRRLASQLSRAVRSLRSAGEDQP